MVYKESKILELKEQMTNSFLKTVSAFANFAGGEIIFGINDNGKIIGIKNLDEACTQIENKIVDSIKPIPDFSLEIDHTLNTIKVIVEPGEDKPYFYKKKSYIRRNTTTTEADKSILKKLIMESSNIRYEETESVQQNLSFSYLKNKMKKEMKIKNFDEDIMITLGLVDVKGNYNIAASLLADQNKFLTIDTVKFDNNSQHFSYRKSFDKTCILQAIDAVMDVFEDLYSFENIEGVLRVKHYTVPKEAFREALINAAVHRDWSIISSIKVTFGDDQIEILSPGNLPNNLSEEMFLNQHVSMPRNLILCSIFKRLNYIERLGYGISAIQNSYKQYDVKPKFEFLDNFIKVILPITTNNNLMSSFEKQIINILKYSKPLSSTELAEILDCSKSKAVYTCKNMLNAGLIRKIGNNRSTKYTKL